jgi:hypothetical protein
MRVARARGFVHARCREMGFLAHVPSLLRLSGVAPGEPLPRQKASNLLCALETVYLLTQQQPQAANGAAKDDGAREAALAVLLRSGMLDILLTPATGAMPSTAVRTQVLSLTCDHRWLQQANQHQQPLCTGVPSHS